MTGPEHYVEAERLLLQVADVVSLNYSAQTGEQKADVLSAAQVHATLALTAATAESRYSYVDESRNTTESHVGGTGWSEVLS